MRILPLCGLFAVLAVIAGCENQTSDNQAAARETRPRAAGAAASPAPGYPAAGVTAPRGGTSLYPLSTPPADAGIIYTNAPAAVATPYSGAGPAPYPATAPYAVPAPYYAAAPAPYAGTVFQAPATPADGIMIWPPPLVLGANPPVLADNAYPGQVQTVIQPGVVVQGTAARAPSPYDRLSYPATPVMTPATTYSATPDMFAAPVVSDPYSAPGAATYAAAPYGTTAAATVPGADATGNIAGGAVMPQVTSYQLVPATDIPPRTNRGDVSPSQWFEVLRPGNAAIRIGRISSTCPCIRVSVPTRYIAAGERALIEARTVSRRSPEGTVYGIYVNIVEPEQLVVDSDVTVRY